MPAPMLRDSEIQRKIHDLLGLSIRSVKPIVRWVYLNRDIEIETPYSSIADPDSVMIFSTRVSLYDSGGYKWLFKVSASGNGLIIVGGKIHQGFDSGHTSTQIASGDHEITLQITPRALFGENPWVFHFNYSAAVLTNWRGLSLGIGLAEALRLARISGDPLRRDLIALLSRVLWSLDLVPTISQVVGAEILLGDLGDPLLSRWDRRYIASVYGYPVLAGMYRDIDDPRMGEADRVIDEIYRLYIEELEDLIRRYPKTGEIFVFGHCHIDAAWLWPYSETRRKIPRSFYNIIRLFEDGYRLSYAQSSAQYYRWAEDYGELFEKIRALVSGGLWIPVGGMWVEPDTNLVTGESLARQLLLGQIYFLDRFGRLARIGWIPDSFGFSAQLPQIMGRSGIEVLVTHKVMWNDTNKFPHQFFLWEGIDGTAIPVHVMPITYNGSATSEEIKRVWESHAEKEIAPAVHAIGVGDGGGGPNAVMLERIQWINRLPSLPRIETGFDEDRYISIVRRAAEKAPRWVGELYVEIHRGTYTTNHRIKDLVSRAEECLRTAEIWSTIAYSAWGKGYPRDRLRGLWEILLRSEFHDVLPGSANFEAYREAYSELEEAIRVCENLVEEAIASIAGPRGSSGRFFAVFNSLPWGRRALIRLPRGFYRYYGEEDLEIQDLGDSVIAIASLPPLGHITLERVGEAVGGITSGVKVSKVDDIIEIENNLVRISLKPDGSLVIEDLINGFRVDHELRAHRDMPGDWDAWDIERSSIEDPGERLEPIDRPRILYGGPLLGCAEAQLTHRGSSVVLTICLARGSSVVVVRSRIAWRSRGYLLKAWMRPSFDFNDIHYEIPFGVIRRSSKPRDRWDLGKFEVPALRWVDISDGAKGFSIISTSKHGYSPREGAVGLTLAKTPLFPDPYSGLKTFEASYYIYTHRGDYKDGETPRIAYELWSPPRVRQLESPLPQRSYISIDNKIAILEAMKMTEKSDEIVLRIYNASDREEKAKIKIWRSFTTYEGDLLERKQGREIYRGSEMEVRLKPFEIKTLILG